MKSKEELKSFFENGDIPKQDQFWEWQDSYWHKEEKLPLENVDYDFSNKADLIDGKIPATQLPSYVDDILEFDSLADLPNPGEGGKIYIVTSTNTQLRWSGSEYIQIISGENVMITDSPQGIFPDGTKTFWTDGGNSHNNNSLWVRNTNSGGAGITFTGNGVGQVIFNNDQFHFTDNDGTNSIPVVSEGFKKEGSNNEFYLTGGGDHVHNLVKEDAWYHSHRNFPNGTLIETDVDYSQDYGDQFLLEIKGNMYDNSMPLDAKIQGYIYLNGTNPLLNVAGYTTCYYWKSITALNRNGKLCFWFPQLSYWQGFDVKLTVGYGGIGQGKNRVISVIDSSDPIGTKRVDIYLKTLATQEFVSSQPFGNITSAQINNWDNSHEKTIVDFNKISSRNGDTFTVNKQDGSIISHTFYGAGIVDTRVQGNGLDSDGSSTYIPNSSNPNLDYKVTPLFHDGSRGWQSSLLLKGWGDNYKAWKITGDANADDIERDVYISSSKSSDGTWLPERKIWTEKNFNPDSKVDSVENATAVGFQNGLSTGYPYFYHNTDGHVPLATQFWTDDNFYTKPEVDAKFSAVYRPKGSVANYASLPSSGNTEGDVWNLLDTGSNYVWTLNLNNTGAPGWDKLSETIDLTAYYTQTQINSMLEDHVTLDTPQNILARKTFGGASGNRFDTGAIETKGNGSTIYPAIGFHQPGLYAGTISLRNSNQFSFRNTDDSDYNYLLAKGYIKSGSNDSYILLGGGDHRQVSDFVDTSTVGQSINARKVFGVSSVIDNSYGGAGLEIDGNGSNLFPTIGFHQPGHYALTMSVRGNGFNFMDYSGTLLTDVNAAKFIKGGSDDTRVLLGGGGDKLITDFVLDTDLYSYYNNFLGGVNNQNMLLPNGNQAISIGNSGTDFDGELSNKTLEGTFANFNAFNSGIKDLGFTLFAPTSTNQGIYYKTWYNGNQTTWKRLADANELNSYVTIYTPQDIYGRKAFAGSAGNGYSALPLEVRGNGSSIYPGIAFHQPGAYAGTISMRTSDKFYFRNTGDTDFVNLYAAGYIKSGSDDNYLLLGGGGHKQITDFVLDADLNNYWSKAELPDYRNYGLGRTDAISTPDLNAITHTSIQDIFDTTLNRPPDNFGYGSVWTHRKGGNEFTQMAINVLDGRFYSRGWSTGLGDTGWKRAALYSEVVGKANALENATGIGFSSGNYPTNNGADYPYIYYSNPPGSNTPYVALATQAYVQNTFATIGSLGNYVTINTPQTIIADKTLAQTAKLNILGNELNHTTSFNLTSGSGNIASGWLHSFYGNVWKYGTVRGGDSSADEVKFGFDFSSDSGTTFNRVFAIDANSGTLELKAGGTIDQYGNTLIKQTTSGGHATGTFWKNKDGSGNNVAAIGTLFNDGDLQYSYIGWGTAPWVASTCLALGQDTFLYKGNQVWHSGILEDYHQYGLGSINVSVLSDLDTYSGYQTGFYSFNLSANRPYDYGTTIKVMRSSNEGTEIAVDVFGNGLSFRGYVGGAYTPWHAVWHNGNLPNPASISDLSGYVPYTGATSNIDINSKNLSTTGNVYAGAFNSAVFFNPNMAGGFIINSNASELYFGNTTVGTTFYQALGSHNFFIDGVNKAFINSTGLNVVGNINATNFIGNYFGSTSLDGGDILNVAAHDVLVLGNNALPNIYYSVLSNHVFIAGGSVVTTINAGGLAVTGALSLNGQDVATQSWVGANYTPLSHVGSGGAAHANATTSTAGFMSSTDKTKLDNINTSNFVTTNTVQTISEDKTFDLNSTVSFTGNDQNNVLVHKTSTGLAGALVSGHDYTHYNSRWRTGLVRGSGTNSTEFSFLYSSDNGASFSERMKIDAGNGQITTAIHGTSADWNDIAQNGIRSGNTGFTVLEDYKEIDSNTFDIDDNRVKNFNVVFDASSNGQVIIHTLLDGQTYHLHNFSTSNILRVDVEGYGNVDNIEPGETRVYMAHHGGHLRRISASNTETII